MALAPWPLVTVDIDGTLTRRHGWEVIADSLGRRRAFDRTATALRAGTIDPDEHLRNLLAIATGSPLARVEEALATTPFLAGIEDGISEIHRTGGRVALLTHNPAYVCRWYVRRFGFDDYEATDIQEVRDGIVQPPREIRSDKWPGLEALARRARVPPGRIVHIGDGAADAALFPRVGRGVALNPEQPAVAQAADLVLRSDDFREVAGAVGKLGPRP